MDRKLRRSGDGARIAGTLELDDLGMLGRGQERIWGICLICRLHHGRFKPEEVHEVILSSAVEEDDCRRRIGRSRHAAGDFACLEKCGEGRRRLPRLTVPILINSTDYGVVLHAVSRGCIIHSALSGCPLFYFLFSISRHSKLKCFTNYPPSVCSALWLHSRDSHSSSASPHGLWLGAGNPSSSPPHYALW